MRRTLYGLALPVYGFAALAWVLAVVLTLTATTLGGRAAGVGFLAGLPGLVLLSLWPFVASRGRLAGLLLSAVLPAGLGVSAWQSPTGASGDRFRSVWYGEVEYPRYALANLVPEVDQFTLGGHVLVIDPALDRPKRARLRGLFQAIYGDMRSDPDFVQAGSTMSFAYRDVFGLPSRSDHLYLLLPEGPGPHPTALFLHGSLGNFKGYQWVLKDLAERCGVAIVSPDFGAGSWNLPEGLRVIQRTLAWMEAQPELRVGPMPLMGLSNGGRGVSRAALEWPERWTGLVYFSGVIEPSLTPDIAALDLPVMVLDGGADARIPKAYTDQAVAHLDQLDRRTWRDEDHFLFFSEPQAMVDHAARAICPFNPMSPEGPSPP